MLKIWIQKKSNTKIVFVLTNIPSCNNQDAVPKLLIPNHFSQPFEIWVCATSLIVQCVISSQNNNKHFLINVSIIKRNTNCTLVPVRLVNQTFILQRRAHHLHSWWEQTYRHSHERSQSHAYGVCCLYERVYAKVDRLPCKSIFIILWTDHEVAHGN